MGSPWLPDPQSCPSCPFPPNVLLLFFLNFMYLFVQAVLAPHCCARICGEQGLLPSCGGRAAYCQGFPGGGTWALGRADFSSCGCGSGLVRRFLGSGARAPQLRCLGFMALWHVGSSRARDGICVRCIGRRILIRGAAGEVPRIFF